MKTFKVLGSGCRKCVATAKAIKAAARDMGLEARVEKVTDTAAILAHGVMSTPAVVLDGTVVHVGGVPSTSDIKDWLAG